MIGQFNPRSQEVTVIGGGVSGLLIAYYLTKSDYKVTLYEAGSRWGGLIQTQLTPLGIAESAAHSILATPKVQELFEDLGVNLIEVDPHSRTRWILRNGQLRRFPLTWSESVQALIRTCWTRSSAHDPQTMTEWAQNHLGQSALDYLINPMLRGIFGATPNDILVNAAFPALTLTQGESLAGRLLANHFKSSGPKAKMMAPHKGMESLILGLESYLKNRLTDRMHLNASISELPRAENMVLAVPPPKAAELLTGVDSALATSLHKIRWSSLITTTIFLERSRLKKIPNGVGVLMPAIENRRCLGILFNSSSFSDRVTYSEKWVSITVISEKPIHHRTPFSEYEFLENIQRELELLFGWVGPIEHYLMTHWPQAIPMYDGNLMKVWDQARAGWCSQPGQILAGNYTGEVSIRGMIETMGTICPRTGPNPLGSK